MGAIQNSKDIVTATALKKDPGANATVLRRSLDYVAESFSIQLTRKNIQALLQGAKLNANVESPGVLEKFFVDDFINRVSSAR
jgi:hypothetical protein